MIEFETHWREYAVNHLKSEGLARGLIRNAAVALAERHMYPGLMFWIEAALGGAGVLNVLKGLHQPKGVSHEVLHLTMCLYSIGSKKGSLQHQNTAFATRFHLDTTILNPKAAPEEYQLVPTILSYKTAWTKEQLPPTKPSYEAARLNTNNDGFVEVTIVGARVLTNNLK